MGLSRSIVVFFYINAILIFALDRHTLNVFLVIILICLFEMWPRFYYNLFKTNLPIFVYAVVAASPHNLAPPPLSTAPLQHPQSTPVYYILGITINHFFSFFSFFSTRLYIHIYIEIENHFETDEWDQLKNKSNLRKIQMKRVKLIRLAI